jgi:hypothetical protein
MNPDVDDANIIVGASSTKYDAMQIELRRRLSQGLTVSANYTFARTIESDLDTLRRPRAMILKDDGVPHAFKVTWLYEVPVGRGKRFGANWNRWLDGVLGGWEFSGAGRAQTPTFRLTNTNIVGMSFDEAQDLFRQLRFTTDEETGAPVIFNMPTDVIENTILAFDTDPTVAGFYQPGSEPQGRFFAPATCDALPIISGNCAPDLYFTGRWFAEFDFRIVKKFPIGRRATFEFAGELFNAFNAVNFNHALNPTSGDPFRITGGASGARQGQLVWRVSW